MYWSQNTDTDIKDRAYFENSGMGNDDHSAENRGQPGQTGRVCSCYECRGRIHVVREGDTLFTISRQHRVSIDDLLDANPMINVYRLREGDQICVPVRTPQPRTQNTFDASQPRTMPRTTEPESAAGRTSPGKNTFDAPQPRTQNAPADLGALYPYTDLYEEFINF